MQLGSKNHYAWFPYLFLPHLYDVIRSDIKKFIIMNKLPFGVMTDKMTTKHLTRHMVGIPLPIWDVRNPFLTKYYRVIG